ncbi:MAG: hypothetical protein IJ306_03770, partial [Oscillospiraceae bacterium]|nr:hypothetical protein [Oscillospiraceae bacterium]
MELLRFTVCNQRLSGGRNKLVSDSIDYVEAYFDFRTSDWSGLSKWAHFCKGEEVYDINLVDDKITKDMHLNLGAGTWEVKLHGNDPEGTMRITTDRAHVVVESYGSLEEGAPLPEVPLSAAEQIDAKAQEALDVANSVRADADKGVFDPIRGTDYWTEEDKAEIVEEAVKLVKTGAQGEPGKTAYEYAVEGGYTGTEEEFYEDLALSDERFEKIESDIADLKYVALEAVGLSVSPSVAENGDVVTAVTFSWEFNKVPVSITIGRESDPFGIVEVEPSQKGSYLIEGEFSAGGFLPFPIIAEDERGATVAVSVRLYFYDGIYYGCAAKPDAVDSEFILSLAKKLSGGKNLTVSATGGDGLYFFYAYPASMGESIFNIGG